MHPDYEVNKKIAVITLNKPESLNSLDLSCLTRLCDLITQAEQDPKSGRCYSPVPGKRLLRGPRHENARQRDDGGENESDYGRIAIIQNDLPHAQAVRRCHQWPGMGGA